MILFNLEVNSTTSSWTGTLPPLSPVLPAYKATYLDAGMPCALNLPSQDGLASQVSLPLPAVLPQYADHYSA